MRITCNADSNVSRPQVHKTCCKGAARMTNGHGGWREQCGGEETDERLRALPHDCLRVARMIFVRFNILSGDGTSMKCRL